MSYIQNKISEYMLLLLEEEQKEKKNYRHKNFNFERR